jgi:hypothetical protein
MTSATGNGKTITMAYDRGPQRLEAPNERLLLTGVKG